MHDAIQDGLEAYLSGSRNRAVESHLSECADCRREVGELQALSGYFGALRGPSEPSVPLGFEARLRRMIEAQKRRSLWTVFALNPGLTRKLALASLLGLLAFGSYLASQPADDSSQSAYAPEAVMARHSPDVPADSPQRTDGMLVTLANYHQ